nr:succinate dehydrogenase assembly factor 4 [Sinimarinibacterium sp. CAU 1509]
MSALLKQMQKQDPASEEQLPATAPKQEQVREIGGRSDGLEPTRYGDWEKNGRCIDF